MRIQSACGCMAMIIAILASPLVARADQVSTQIVTPSQTPVLIKRCQVDTTGNYGSPSAWVNIQNRTRHQLITADVEYSFYDTDKALFAQATIRYTPGTPVASGDIQQFSGGFYPQHSEPFNVTAYVTCRVDAATFTGEKSWHYGERWHEPLVSENGPPQTSNDIVSSSVGGISPPKLTVRVLSAWEDQAPSYQSGYYVHDRLSISGADRDVSVHPHDFILRVITSTGEMQSIRGLSSAAPQYAKINYATNQSVLTPEVAVDEDLGAHGSLDVPAHSAATTVVTFYVPVPIDTSRLSDVAYL